MLFGWKKTSEPVAHETTQRTTEPVKRDLQQNIKVSRDCAAHFAALAKAQGMSRAELFEDLVVERLEALQRRGVKVEVSAS